MQQCNFITTADGKTICVACRNVTGVSPIAVIQIIRDIRQPFQEYDKFAKYLNAHGYIVVSNTSDVPDSTPDWFETILNGEIATLKFIKDNFDLPVCIFAHKFGTFIGRCIMHKSELGVARFCMSGEIFLSRAWLHLARISARIGIMRHGPAARARLWQQQFAPNTGLPYGPCYSLFKNLLRLPHFTNNETPVLFINNGTELHFPAGHFATKLYNTYKEHDLRYLTIIIYPNVTQDILNCQNHNDVWDDIVGFMNNASRAGYAAQIA